MQRTRKSVKAPKTCRTSPPPTQYDWAVVSMGGRPVLLPGVFALPVSSFVMKPTTKKVIKPTTDRAVHRRGRTISFFSDRSASFIRYFLS